MGEINTLSPLYSTTIIIIITFTYSYVPPNEFSTSSPVTKTAHAFFTSYAS
jgi:hypothetical protein